MCWCGVNKCYLVLSNCCLNYNTKLFLLPDSQPLPLTPDYGGPLVRYADGVFDKTFNRYVAVREGMTICMTCSAHLGILVHTDQYLNYIS